MPSGLSNWWMPACWSRLGREPAHWRFGGASLHRAHAALRLQRDLEINLAGVALALELLDEIESLRMRLRAMGGE